MWNMNKNKTANPVSEEPKVQPMKPVSELEICESLKKLGFKNIDQNRILCNEVLKTHIISISQSESDDATSWGKKYITFNLLDKTFRVSRYGAAGYLMDLDIPLVLAILEQARAFGWVI